MRERVQFDGVAGGRIACDTRHFPYVLMRTTGLVEVSIVDRYSEWQRDWFDRMTREPGRCVWITDVQSDVPTPAVRRHVAQRRREFDDLYDRWVIRELIVVDNALVRGVFTMFRLLNPRVEVETLATLDKALERGRALLQDEGIIAPRLHADAFEVEG